MWSSIEPLFKRVTDETNGCYAPADVLLEILKGDQSLWVSWDEERQSIDAVMTMAIVNYPRRKTCKVIYISGSNMRAWRKEFMEISERYARDMGATAMEGGFRRGWAKVAGYRETGVSLFKELAA